MASWHDSVLRFSAVPAIGKLLLSPAGAWVWSRDGARLHWANPAGGRLIGAGTFSAAWTRRWPSGHPLRRELQALLRGMPESGATGRLRIANTPSAVPIACRCSPIRAGDERGMLVEASGALPGFSPAEAVPAFFSDESVTAFLTEHDSGPAGDDADPSGGSIRLDAGGRLYYFRLVALSAAPNAAATGDAPAETEHGEAVDGPSVVGGDAEAPLSTPGTLAEPTPLRVVPAGDRVQILPAGPNSAGHPLPQVDRDEQPRSVTVGRVPRELSRKPVRFLWQTDASDRFLFISPGLEQVVGRNAEIVGERWQDLAARLGIDPLLRISRTLAERDTWSGQTAWWPIEGSGVRVPTELTALPIYGADHSFQGYRGFGILRPAEALMPAAYQARFGSADHGNATLAEQLPPYEEAPTTAPAPPASANVVPIRADLDRADHVRLTAQERSAFEEIAAALRERVEATDFGPQGPPPSETGNAAEAGGARPLPAETGAADGSGHRTSSQEPASTAEDRPLSGSSVPVAPKPTPAAAASHGSLATSPAEGSEMQPHLPEAAEPHEGPAAKPSRAVPELWVMPPPSSGQDAPTSPSSAVAPPRVRGRAAPPDSEAQRRVRELTAILDTATDGVVILDANGIIESVNASAEALFGLDANELQGVAFTALLTPATRGAAEDYISGLRENGVASLLNEGREVEARAGAGSIPLFITMGRISNGDASRFCAVLRDITHWKRTEADLVAAKAAAEAASTQKSEFLARVSHEIRTPLNAIIGFAEAMIEERFGPVENERYREYLRDIRTSSEHVVSLVNDLLDIAKIEAGKLDLHFTAVPLNDIVRECIAIMQPQASRAHVILRSSLSRDVPGVVADARTLRQIVLNLLSNSVKFTGPGGQVIASTTLADTGEALLRIRDTGEGMSEEELARALEPFRQVSAAKPPDVPGTGLGLPLTKALVEANRAALAIRSARGEGTVVTITFSPTRVLSE